MNFYTLISNSTRSHRKFVLLTLFSAGVIITMIVATNYIIDPLRTFAHSDMLNNKQVGFDERQQKTNYLYFVDNTFDSVLLGSSRTTFIDQTLFAPEKVFNYAANGMSPYEYDRYLANFIKITGHAPQKIYIGMDFFGTNTFKNRLYKNTALDRPFLHDTQQKGYRYKKLFNAQVFEHSLKNILQNIKAKKPYYTRSNIKLIPDRYIKASKENTKNTLRSFEKYTYDGELLAYYQSLKQKYKDSQFVIFTTPVYHLRLANYEKAGLDQYYVRWLRELVGTFGEVNHFMYDNAFTQNESNYFDASHFRPSKAPLIVNSITQNTNNQYMTVLKPENLETFIADYLKTKDGAEK